MKRFILTIIAILLTATSFCQEVLQSKIFDKNIKTVLMYLGDDEMSFPILDLGSSKFLKLRFDELGTDSKDYTYTLIHCNSDWTPSDLDKSEYIDGYFEDQIADYQSSFNTSVNYIHYNLQIPNDYMRPTVSGNYVLQVSESSNPQTIIFNKRFMLVERKTDIKAFSRNMNQGAYFYNDQELEIVVDYFGNQFYDLSQNLKVQVLKNRNWAESLELTQPDVIKDNEFTFNNFSKLKFKGGNEFYHFNTKDIHHYLENIVNISFTNNSYHFQLVENTDRTFQDYKYQPDINGQFKIDVSGSDYPSTEADYSYVYFTLKMQVPIQLGDVYVWGGLTNYNFGLENKMHYNFETKAYECRLFLKQGYYNYQYVLMEKGKPDFTYIEGNHAQTENQYLILVYYHDIRLGSDRLIGVSEFSSGIEGNSR